MNRLRIFVASVALTVPAIYAATLQIFPSSAGPRAIVFKIAANETADSISNDKPVRLGSIDLIEEVPEGTHLVGWVSRRTKTVTIIVNANPFPKFYNALSQERPDVVAALGDPLQLYSGFDIVIPKLRVLDIKCVVASDGTSDVVLRDSSSDC
jgi:hypothetical protein